MIEWTDAYSTGDERIDREHQRLFEAINDLEFALHGEQSQEALETAVDFLSRYAKWHFANEEDCMLRANCPAHGVNCAAHKVFNERINTWRDRIAKGSPPLTARDIYVEAAGWIQQHILKIDTKLRGSDARVVVDQA